MTSREWYEQVARKDPRFQGVAKIAEIAMLEPVTRDLANGFVSAGARRGLDVRVIETLRSMQRQRWLFARGKTQRREVGCHQMAVAFDSAIFRNGEPDWKADYHVFAEMALEVGLIWGGDWGTPQLPHVFRDSDHLQRVSIADQSRMWRGEWYPEPGYDPRGNLPVAPVDVGTWLGVPYAMDVAGPWADAGPLA